MLAHSNTIRDVSRALPALAAAPNLEVAVSAELLDAHAKGLREWYDSLLPVIDRAGNTLAEAMKTHDSEESADPDGEGVRALEQAEAYFKDRREELLHLRDAFASVGASSSHEVFEAVDRLDGPYLWIVATMQEVRWSVLILDGVKDGAEAQERRTITSPSEWVASLDDE